MIKLKSTKNHKQFDANLNIKLRNKIWFGASYRTSPNEASDIQEAFILCSLHVTAYSTSIFEASLVGVPTIIIIKRINTIVV